MQKTLTNSDMTYLNSGEHFRANKRYLSMKFAGTLNSIFEIVKEQIIIYISMQITGKNSYPVMTTQLWRHTRQKSIAIGGSMSRAALKIDDFFSIDARHPGIPSLPKYSQNST
jgi:hypothetical protein